MSYGVVFSRSAAKDLDNIQRYICSDNFEAAREVILHITTSIDKLVDNPALGRAGRVLHTRELVITKYPYIVPYQVRGDVIHIIRILHTSRKWL